MTELCSRDMAVTELYLQVACDRMLDASVYLPYESTEAPPTLELRRIVEFGAKRKRHLVLRRDTNSQQTSKGHTGVNNRSQCLLNFITESG